MGRVILALPTLGLAAFLLLGAWADAFAADPGEAVAVEQLRAADGPLARETVRDLVARLSDEQVRALLLERLDAVAAAEAEAAAFEPAQLVQQLQGEAETVRQRLVARLAAAPELPGLVPAALAWLLDGRPPVVLLWTALGFALMIAGGWLAERLFHHAIADARRLVVEARPVTLSGRVGFLMLRLGLDAAGLAVFLLSALAVFLILHHGHEPTRLTLMTYLAAIGVVRGMALFSRLLLAPQAPQLRLAHMSDPDAAWLHRRIVVLAAIAAFGTLTASLFALIGLGGDALDLLVTLLGLVLFVGIVQTVWQGCEVLAGDIRGEEPVAPARRVFAGLWPGLLIAFLVLFYLTILILGLAGSRVSFLAAFGTLLTILFLPHLDAALERAALDHQRETGERGQLQAVVLRALRIALVVVAALFVARIWSIDLVLLAEAGVGTRIAGALLDIGLTALIAYVLWQVTRIAIDRRMAAEAAGGGTVVEQGEAGGVGGSRLSTILPLIKRAIQAAIAVIAAMVVLSALGVNIGPLIAGAGVVGIAIGFGAQTLVRDIVSGIFFLADDAFRVGEYIDVGNAKGTVEKISVRSLRLRHHRGPLNTVPFGEIATLTNFSRDWVVMKLEFRVPFDTDIQKVKKIFKQIGKDLLANPELGPDFLAPFKSQGVFSVDDSALILRAKFIAKPGRQFIIRREAYAAVQKAFAEHGIRFADRRVTVSVPGAEAMPPEQRAAVERAAASAAAREPNPAAAAS
jgi:moderate conductance mechanosensitive channel